VFLGLATLIFWSLLNIYFRKEFYDRVEELGIRNEKLKLFDFLPDGVLLIEQREKTNSLVDSESPLQNKYDYFV